MIPFQPAAMSPGDAAARMPRGAARVLLLAEHRCAAALDAGEPLRLLHVPQLLSDQRHAAARTRTSATAIRSETNHGDGPAAARALSTRRRVSRAPLRRSRSPRRPTTPRSGGCCARTRCRRDRAHARARARRRDRRGASKATSHQTMVARERDGRPDRRRSRSRSDARRVRQRPSRAASAISASSASACAAIASARCSTRASHSAARCTSTATPPPIYAAIVEDNHAARRLLCGLRSPAAPRFVRAARLVTLAIPRAPGRRARLRGRPASRSRRGLRRAPAATSWPASAQRAALPVHAALDRRRSARPPGERRAWRSETSSSRSPADASSAARRCGISARSNRRSCAAIRGALARWRPRGQPGGAAGRRARAAARRGPLESVLPVARGGRRRPPRRRPRR